MPQCSPPALKIAATSFSAKTFSQQKVQLNDLDFSKSEFVATVDTGCLNGSQGKFKSNRIHFKARQPASLNNDNGLVSAVVSVEAANSMLDLNSTIEEENCIVGLSENVKMYKFAIPNDPRLGEQKNLAAIGFQESYDFYDTNLSSSLNNTVVIATIDDGINLSHPDLKPIIWVNAQELNGTTGVDDDGNGYVDDINGYDFASGTADPSHKSGPAHGSHVAGLAAAASNNSIGISGVATKNVKVMALNVFGLEAGTSSATIDEAIRYAANNGANVINLSLGGQGRSPSTLTALQYAISKGVVVVAAAGNDGVELTDTVFFSPGSYAKDLKGMLSVGASNASNTAQICDFSNFSSTYVEIVAPGCDSQFPTGLLSTISESNYTRFNGTSMATPQVSGAAAIAFLSIKNRSKSNPTPAEIEDTLLNSAKVEPTLLTKAKGGKHLHIDLMANLITTSRPLALPPMCM